MGAYRVLSLLVGCISPGRVMCSFRRCVESWLVSEKLSCRAIVSAVACSVKKMKAREIVLMCMSFSGKSLNTAGYLVLLHD